MTANDRPDETPYVETELLLAVMNNDIARIMTLLTGMTPGETRRLARQARDLSRWCEGG